MGTYRESRVLSSWYACSVNCWKSAPKAPEAPIELDAWLVHYPQAVYWGARWSTLVGGNIIQRHEFWNCGVMKCQPWRKHWHLHTRWAWVRLVGIPYACAKKNHSFWPEHAHNAASCGVAWQPQEKIDRIIRFLCSLHFKGQIAQEWCYIAKDMMDVDEAKVNWYFWRTGQRDLIGNCRKLWPVLRYCSWAHCSVILLDIRIYSTLANETCDHITKYHTNVSRSFGALAIYNCSMSGTQREICCWKHNTWFSQRSQQQMEWPNEAFHSIAFDKASCT